MFSPVRGGPGDQDAADPEQEVLPRRQEEQEGQVYQGNLKGYVLKTQEGANTHKHNLGNSTFNLFDDVVGG